MKRIVFVEPGGLHRIVGVEDPFTHTVTAANFPCGGRVVSFASLYRVTTRAAYYREPIVPASYSFHEAQQ